jgi:type VI secretion system protein ImpK
MFVQAGVPADRIKAEGRADGESVAANDTPANRALNRRVEVTLFTARTDLPARGAGAAAPSTPVAPVAPAASGAGR